MPKSKPKPEPAPDALKRERAGTYRSVDGRFTVEQASSGWMVLDAEQTDGLGLPLTRGPFSTLDDAKAVMADARSGAAPVAPAPTGRGGPRLTVVPSTDHAAGSASGAATTRKPRAATARSLAAAKAPPKAGPERPARAAAPPIVIRELRGTDGDALRRLWKQSGLGSVGDDDRSLSRMARRNPGLVLVAVEGTQIVASALGGWDGRRGWIYHVATATSHRRQGIATRLVDQIEAALAVLGAPKVNVLVRPESEEGQAFWEARGYAAGTARHFGKEL